MVIIARQTSWLCYKEISRWNLTSTCTLSYSVWLSFRPSLMIIVTILYWNYYSL